MNQVHSKSSFAFSPMITFVAVCFVSMLSACGPDCQTSCEKLYAQGGECEFTSAGDATGEKNFARCIEHCESALAVPGEAGDYNPQEKTPSSQSIELQNDQQAAMWMDCVEEKSCELLKTSGGRFCAPIW